MHVIIVGTGPSGLVLALLLARAKIQVTLLDAADKVDNRPRAAHYAPSAIRELSRAGVLEDIRAQGFIPGDMCWRMIDGSLIVQFKDSSQKSNPEALTVLPLGLLGEVLIRHVNKYPNIQTKWNHKVIDVGQDKNSVWAVVRLKDGSEIKVFGDYLCGCDGANSQVRKCLFGESNFPGKTWDAQIVATNVYYPLDKFGYEDINFVVHPTDYYMAARITRDGMWRVSYGEDISLTLEELLERQPMKYERMLPGNPKPGDYKLTNCNPYRIHQRCSPSFRVGRVCLAADAAHLCNPFGGLGLTGGLVDVGGLADCLAGIHTGQADDSILDKYSEVRMHIYKTIIDVVSSANFLRVSSKDPQKTAETDEMITLYKRANEDRATKEFLDKSLYDICHDFTQYYHNGKAKL